MQSKFYATRAGFCALYCENKMEKAQYKDWTDRMFGSADSIPYDQYAQKSGAPEFHRSPGVVITKVKSRAEVVKELTEVLNAFHQFHDRIEKIKKLK